MELIQLSFEFNHEFFFVFFFECQIYFFLQQMVIENFMVIITQYYLGENYVRGKWI